MSTRHFLTVDDLDEGELAALLNEAASMKADPDAYDATLDQQTLAMLFEKPSTRTRVSFETGMTQLGGHAIFLGPDDTQLSRGEPLRDTARALSRYVDVIMARVYDHGDLAELAAHANVPVVNGLSDRAHPCQTLGDLLTIREHVGELSEATVAWIGDGNNVAQSLAVGCALADVDLRVATPDGHGLDDEVLDRASGAGARPELTSDPREAADGADVVYTDVFVSMGEEGRREEKLGEFDGYSVTRELLDAGDSESLAMHCLPAHRGEEITDGVMESDRAVVWDQAENRLHAQKALIRRMVA